MTTTAQVRPAIQGTNWLSRSLGMRFTLGREALQNTSPDIASQSGGAMAVDIETYGLGTDARKIKCVTFANTGHALILDPRDPVQSKIIRDLTSGLDTLIFHNSAFDVPNLILNGLMRIEDIAKVVDTILYARLAEPSEFGGNTLSTVGERYLGLTPDGASMTQIFREIGWKKSDGYRYSDLHMPFYIYGAAWDALITARVRDVVRNAAGSRLTNDHPFTKTGLDAHEAWDLVEREQVMNRMFLRRSARGIRIDEDFPEKYAKVMHGRLAGAQEVLNGAGIRPGNASDLVEKLDLIGALPSTHPKTPTGKLSTAKGHLEWLGHPLAQAYVAHKEIGHVQKDYLDKCIELAVDGRIHPEANLLKAVTGRMSMSNLAFQQYSAKARGILLADEGDSLTSIDWSQIEPVVAANLARDFESLTAYEQGNGDLYADIASKAGVERKQAKVVLLAQFYGQGLDALAASLGTDLDGARDLKESIMSAMPRVREHIQVTNAWAKQHQLTITMSGRVLPVPSWFNPEKQRKEVQAYKATNYRIQGSAYDLLAEALLEIEQQGLGDGIYLSVHDEIVCSTSVAADIQKIMETPPQRLIELTGRVPVLRTDRKDLGERWGA
jgi:DNA polymerase I